MSAFKTIDDSGRHKHADVLDYWLSIRGDREFPPLHDLDPLAMSDAGPSSALLELIGGGEDAEIRHLGESLRTDVAVERIADAPRPSILACIAKKLSIVAISRNYLAFEDEFPAAGGTTRCWVTLLPLNAAGPWVDYVYAFVTFETVPAAVEAQVEASVETSVEANVETSVEQQPESPPEDAEPPELVLDEVEESTAVPPIDGDQGGTSVDAVEQAADVAPDIDQPAPAELDPVSAADPAAATDTGPGFTELFHDPATADGFYGAPSVRAASARPLVPPAKAEAAEPASSADGPLQARLAAVRAKADAARLAKLHSNTTLYEGLGAAYDFALDAEDNPEEYLKLVEAQGLKIQLRSPMLPVMKLAFAGMCDDPTIARLEAVLAWALEQELPRGTLADRIEAAGGLARILGGEAPAS